MSGHRHWRGIDQLERLKIGRQFIRAIRDNRQFFVTVCLCAAMPGN